MHPTSNEVRTNELADEMTLLEAKHRVRKVHMLSSAMYVSFWISFIVIFSATQTIGVEFSSYILCVVLMLGSGLGLCRARDESFLQKNHILKNLQQPQLLGGMAELVMAPG